MSQYSCFFQLIYVKMRLTRSHDSALLQISALHAIDHLPVVRL